MSDSLGGFLVSVYSPRLVVAGSMVIVRLPKGDVGLLGVDWLDVELHIFKDVILDEF